MGKCRWLFILCLNTVTQFSRHFAFRHAAGVADDDGVKGISQLKHLESLDLSNSWITDDAVEDLKKLKYLGFLNIKGTKVTEAGVAKLKLSFPNASIRD